MSKLYFSVVIVLLRIAGANMILVGIYGLFSAFVMSERRASNIAAGVLALAVGAVLLFFPRSRLPDSASVQSMYDRLRRR